MRGRGGEHLERKPTTFECILELLQPLVLAPLGSICPLATTGAILFAGEEVRELCVKGMTTEATGAENTKRRRARANGSLESEGNVRETDKAVFDVLMRIHVIDVTHPLHLVVILKRHLNSFSQPISTFSVPVYNRDVSQPCRHVHVCPSVLKVGNTLSRSQGLTALSCSSAL